MKTVIAGALGECVHVAGVMNFLKLAEEAGWQTIFLGPATPIEKFLHTAQSLLDQSQEPDSESLEEILVGISYRLTPESGERLLGEFAEAADSLRSAGVRFAFGGTPPLAERAQQMGFFERVFQGGESPEVSLAYLKRIETRSLSADDFPQYTIERIHWKAPYPLLRHHFGLPSLLETQQGIEQISDSQVLDVISLGIDQDAQQNFFHPERQDPRRTGAGGVPVRSTDDYRILYQATRRGNYPLLRTYSGTDDFIRLAAMYVDTIHIAWSAVPIFWFNQMDGRGPWNLLDSIKKHQELIAWYANQGIPVELNEPHHWGMRDAPDVVFVISAFLSAFNARALGVRDYIAQFMFNSPPGLSDAMDLAKMLAILEMIQPLETPSFHIWRQTRTGLLSYPLEASAARAHLAASIYLQMSLLPHIVHVVGYNEALHAASAQEVIESCQLAQRAIQNALNGQPVMKHDPRIQTRKLYLVEQAKFSLKLLQEIGYTHDLDETQSFINPENLARAVSLGILDAPHLRGNPYAPGRINAKIIDGANEPVDLNGKPIDETVRLADLCHF